MRRFGRLEISDVISAFPRLYFRLPAPVLPVPRNPEQAARMIVGVRAALILRVASPVDLAQIQNAIIGAIAVDMIDLVFRPFTVNQKPS
jgi:hypothetical protein